MSFSFTSYVVSYVTKYTVFRPIFHSFWGSLLPSCYVSGKGDIHSDEGSVDERESDICVGESVG